MDVLTVNNLSKVYGSKIAVEQLSFRVRRGAYERDDPRRAQDVSDIVVRIGIVIHGAVPFLRGELG